MKEDGGRGEGGRGGGGKEKRGSLWSQGENQEEVTMLYVRTHKKWDLILHKTVNYYIFCMIENERVLKSAKGTDIRRQRIYGTAEIPVPSALGSFAVHYSFAFLCVCVVVLGNLGAARLKPLSSTKFGVEAPISPQPCM